MRTNEERLTGAGGTQLQYCLWQPDDAPRAVILLVHGAAEHIGRYLPFAEWFTARGYAVAGVDLPGHGRSDGEPGFVDKREDYLDAVSALRARAGGDLPGVPQLMLGHSMGGMLATLEVARAPDGLTACILSGPAILSDQQPGSIQMLIFRFLSKVWPRFGAIALDSSGISRDPAEVQRYLDDPLVYNGKLSVRMGEVLVDGMSDARQACPAIRLPLLLVHGGDDPMTSPKGSAFVHEHAATTDKTLIIYPGALHETFNSPEREQVFSDIAAFADRVLAGAATADAPPA